MSRVGYLLKDSELFILLAENSQILLKISVIPILLTFIYLVALNMLVISQLKSLSNSTHRPTKLIIAAHNCHKILVVNNSIKHSQFQAFMNFTFTE